MNGQHDHHVWTWAAYLLFGRHAFRSVVDNVKDAGAAE